MKEDFAILKKEFKRIKNMGLIEPLRNGSTGIGYTFETLLHKKEDQECKPDFRGIELKTKLGYSKSPLILFHCEPKRYCETATNYIFNKYSYPKNSNTRIFEYEVFHKINYSKYNYSFKLDINYYEKRIIMKSYYNNHFIENVCYWDFKVLETKLKIKLTKLALIYVYPYKRCNRLYYRYLKMNIYKLKGFFEFLKLIEDNKIGFQFYLKSKDNTNGSYILENHGVAIRLKNNHIEELFSKIY